MRRTPEQVPGYGFSALRLLRLCHCTGPGGGGVADAGAGAVGALHDDVRAGEVDGDGAVLDDLQRALGGEGVQHAGGQAAVGGDGVDTGDVDARVMRGVLHAHAEIGDERHELEDGGHDAAAAGRAGGEE